MRHFLLIFITAVVGRLVVAAVGLQRVLYELGVVADCVLECVYRLVELRVHVVLGGRGASCCWNDRAAVCCERCRSFFVQMVGVLLLRLLLLLLLWLLDKAVLVCFKKVKTKFSILASYAKLQYLLSM
jgi:uncharacterized integral membrane protein